MNVHNSRSSIIWYEGIGFTSLIALSWLDEFYGLQQLLLGGPQHLADWRDCVMDNLLIVLVWAAVFFFTKRLLSHLLYLEGFLRICAWCRRINYQGKWIGLEEYFAQGFRVETTHGMCSDCFKRRVPRDDDYII